MFTGIVEEVGTLVLAHNTSDGQRLRIGARTVVADLAPGDSVSVSGTCLTACQIGEGWFTAEATQETLRRTKLGSLHPGDAVNLERALRLSDRLGGHLVSGHVDALGTLRSVSPEGFAKVYQFAVPVELSAFFVEKGSVAIDGVSLTVASLAEHPGSGSRASAGDEFVFTVALIPHTLSVTTLGHLKVGDRVNIEADLIGKYVARLMLSEHGGNINKGGLSMSFLAEHGYT
jgi:riboflavin synthase